MGQVFNHVNFKVIALSISADSLHCHMVMHSQHGLGEGLLGDMQEFVHALRATSKRASREDRLRLIFAIFDVDNDGIVSAEDLELMVRQLAGTALS